MANFFSQNDESSAKVNFGGKEWKEALNAEQTKIWLEMQEFCRSAKPGNIYKANYKTSKSVYNIFITAQRFVTLSLTDKPISTLYFRGDVYKKL